MKIYELPFARIQILQHDIAEVIIHDGIEMDLAMVREYHDFLLTHLSHPFSLLINKMHSYTYDFPAQMELCTLTEIHAMGVVVYDRVTRTATEMLATYPRCKTWHMSVFADRDQALTWLIREQRQFDTPITLS